VRASTPIVCSPQGLEGVCDSFEGFSMLCRGTLLCLSPRGAFGPLSLRLACCGQAPEPRACEVDQGPARLSRTTLMHSLGKEERRERRTTLDGRVPSIPGELLAGNSSGSPCPIRYGSTGGHGGALQKCQRVVVWVSDPFDRIRGLDASLRGDSTADFSFSIEYVRGRLEKAARVLAMYRPALSHP
jgi:hypothetical protein